jgi:hypothetical protein
MSKETRYRNWLMLFKEVIAVWSEKQTKPTNIKCNVTDFKADGMYSYHWTING